MKARAQLNFNFRYVRVNEVQVRVSYKGRREYNVEDFEQLVIKLHPIVFNQLTCTMDDLLRSTVKKLVLDVLSQAGRNFNNLGIFLKNKVGIVERPLSSADSHEGSAASPERQAPDARSSVAADQPKSAESDAPARRSTLRLPFLRKADSPASGGAMAGLGSSDTERCGGALLNVSTRPAGRDARRATLLFGSRNKTTSSG